MPILIRIEDEALPLRRIAVEECLRLALTGEVVAGKAVFGQLPVADIERVLADDAVTIGVEVPGIAHRAIVEGCLSTLVRLEVPAARRIDVNLGPDRLGDAEQHDRQRRKQQVPWS
ncbi:MAG: hypothetical protein H0T72_08725 [Chloroflexia bacterium]|nr:hypothetical protein [Chloroflexia bacterium]